MLVSVFVSACKLNCSGSRNLQCRWMHWQSWAQYQVLCWRLRESSCRCVHRCTPSQWQRPAVCCHRPLSMFFITAILILMFRSVINALVLICLLQFSCHFVWCVNMTFKVMHLFLRSEHASTELPGISGHMVSHSVTCHPTQVNVPALTPASELVLDLPTPEGWKAELT